MDNQKWVNVRGKFKSQFYPDTKLFWANLLIPIEIEFHIIEWQRNLIFCTNFEISDDIMHI